MEQNYALGPVEFTRPDSYTLYDAGRGDAQYKQSTMLRVRVPMLVGEIMIGTLQSSIMLAAKDDPTEGVTRFIPSAGLPNARTFSFPSDADRDRYKAHVNASLAKWAGYAASFNIARDAMVAAITDADKGKGKSAKSQAAATPLPPGIAAATGPRLVKGTGKGKPKAGDTDAQPTA